jgi:hypothetical protein
MKKRGGARPGAGRKPKAVEDDLLGFWQREMTIEKRQAIVNRFYEIALGDDLKAAVSAGTLLLAYSVGKPTEKHEHSGDGGGPIILKVEYAE